MAETFKEYLISSLQSTQLFELAYKRKDYIDKVCGYFWEIVTNVLLIKYAQISNDINRSQCINHWLDELDGYVNDLNVDQIECKKIKAIQSAFIKKDSDSLLHIQRGCYKKLKREGLSILDIPMNIWEETIRFINNDIVEIICDESLWDTEEELKKKLNI